MNSQQERNIGEKNLKATLNINKCVSGDTHSKNGKEKFLTCVLCNRVFKSHFMYEHNKSTNHIINMKNEYAFLNNAKLYFKHWRQKHSINRNNFYSICDKIELLLIKVAKKMEPSDGDSCAPYSRAINETVRYGTIRWCLALLSRVTN